MGGIPGKICEGLVAPPQKVKAWRLDAMRNDDRVQMQSMVKKLRKFRSDVPIAARRTIVPANASNPGSSGYVGSEQPASRTAQRKQSKRYC